MPTGMKQYESSLNSKVVKYLNSLPNSHCYKRHAGPFRKGRADVAGTIQGMSIELEGKIGDNTPTPLQREWLSDAGKAGAVTGVFYSLADVKRILKENGIKGIEEN